MCDNNSVLEFSENEKLLNCCSLVEMWVEQNKKIIENDNNRHEFCFNVVDSNSTETVIKVNIEKSGTELLKLLDNASHITKIEFGFIDEMSEKLETKFGEIEIEKS